MKHYRYILWDLDGTLVDTYEGVSKSLAPAFAHYGIDWEGKDYYRFIGPPLRESLPRYTNITAQRAEDVIEMFRVRYNTTGVYECCLFPGAEEVLRDLHEAGYTQAIASSKPEARCREIAAHLGIADLLAEIVGSTPDGRIDDKVEVLQETFRRLGAKYPDFQPADSVLVGDSKSDADGARAMGIDCIGVSFGYGGRKELFEHGVEEIYDDLGAVRDAFLRET